MVLLEGVYYVNCLFIITNKYSNIVVSALYLVLTYTVRLFYIINTVSTVANTVVIRMIAQRLMQCRVAR